MGEVQIAVCLKCGEVYWLLEGGSLVEECGLCGCRLPENAKISAEPIGAEATWRRARAEFFKSAGSYLFTLPNGVQCIVALERMEAVAPIFPPHLHHSRRASGGKQ